MYEVLADNVMVIVNNAWVRTTAILTEVRGGLQVHYTTADGTIVKREAYSKSPYYGKAAKEATEADGK